MKTFRNIFNIVAWVVCLSAISLATFLVYRTISYRSEYIAISREIQSIFDRDEKLSSVRNLARDIGGDMEDLSDLFVDEDSIPVFVGTLEDMGEDHGVDLAISAIDLSKDESSIATMKLRISLVGDWRDVMTAVSQIESMKKAVVIDSLSLARRVSTEDARDSRWSATLETRVLVSKKSNE